MKTIIHKLSFLISILIFPTVAFPQVTSEDYKRADDLARLTADKVYYGSVRPSWIGNTGSFLYENNTPTGVDYVILNTKDLKKRKAFDQVKFAIGFYAATGIKAETGKLPIRNILFSEKFGSFAFVYDNFNWICNLKDYRIVRRDRVTERGRPAGWDWGFRDELANAPVESPDKKWTAFIKNYNVFIRSSDDKNEIGRASCRERV